jgi:hypothetical protein
MAWVDKQRDVIDRYGFDPSERAARSWLWHIDDGILTVIAPADADYSSEPNYEGSSGSIIGGEAWAEHTWSPLA